MQNWQNWLVTDTSDRDSTHDTLAMALSHISLVGDELRSIEVDDENRVIYVSYYNIDGDL